MNYVFAKIIAKIINNTGACETFIYFSALITLQIFECACSVTVRFQITVNHLQQMTFKLWELLH